MRIKLIKEIIEGKRKIIEVADILSVSRQSVSKWIAKYRIEWEASSETKNNRYGISVILRRFRGLFIRFWHNGGD